MATPDAPDVDLESRLADAEAALIFARANEKRLEEENARLKDRCERLSLLVLEASTPANPTAGARKPPLPTTGAPSTRRADLEDRVLNLFLTDGKNLTERKVPGLVGAPRRELQFGTVQARCSASEFVGLRPLKRGEGVPSEVAERAARAAKAKERSLTMSDRAARLFDALQRGGSATGQPDPDDAEDPPAESSRGHVRRSSSVSSLGDDLEGDDFYGERAEVEDEDVGVYEIMWKEGGGEGPLRRLAFETDDAGFAYIREQIGAWSRDVDRGDALADRMARGVVVGEGSDAETENPRASSADPERGEPTASTASSTVAMTPGPWNPTLSEPSLVLTQEQVRCVAATLPARLRRCDWRMTYSSRRDGISLKSLYRAAAREASRAGGGGESVLAVKDTRGNAFGAFATETWRVHPRYYGTGESFVFTASPRCEAHRWSQRNDYFMFGRENCVAAGGGSGFALWLDEELLRGNSGECETFANPCLSGEDTEFEVMYVELWTFVPS